MRIAVFGAGGIGGVIAAHLTKAGHDVALLARGENLRVIQENGLTVEKRSDKFTITPARVTDNPADVGAVDVVLMCVKGWQLREAAKSAHPLCGPDTMVVTFQNGVEAADIVCEELGPERAVPGICSTVSVLSKPGFVCQTSINTHLEFCEADGRISDRVAALRDAFKSAGLLVTTPPDMRAALWRKLLVLGPFSALGCLTRAPVGIWRKIPQTRSLANQCIAELLSLSWAVGIELGADSAERTMSTLDRLPPASLSSMQRDFQAGRRSELESQIGVAVRLSSQYGIEAPLHQMIYAALLPSELKAQGAIDWANARDAD
jgi:2-dehydropantoate 2-reductase